MEKNVQKRTITNTVTLKCTKNDDTNQYSYDISVTQTSSLKTKIYTKGEDKYKVGWQEESSTTNFENSNSFSNQGYNDYGSTVFPEAYRQTEGLKSFINGQSQDNPNYWNSTLSADVAAGLTGGSLETAERLGKIPKRLGPQTKKTKNALYAYFAGNLWRQYGYYDGRTGVIYDVSKKTIIKKR